MNRMLGAVRPGLTFDVPSDCACAELAMGANASVRMNAAVLNSFILILDGMLSLGNFEADELLVAIKRSLASRYNFNRRSGLRIQGR